MDQPTSETIVASLNEKMISLLANKALLSDQLELTTRQIGETRAALEAAQAILAAAAREAVTA